MKHRPWIARAALSLSLVMVSCEESQSDPNESMSIGSASGSAGAPAAPAAAAHEAAPQTVATSQARWNAIPEAMRPTQVLPDLMARVLAPDLASQGVALFTDIVTVQPGSDVMFCTYTSFIAKEKLYLHDTKGAQSRFGHHVILQYTLAPQPVGTHECPAGGLEQQQNQILGGLGEGQNVNYPANVVSEIPAGAQLMINHHWINPTDEAVEAQAEIITVPPPADAGDLVVARSFIVQSTSFNVAARVTGEASVTCPLDRDVALISALGHMHEWGSHIKAERMGSEPDVLFDHDFEPIMAIHPTVSYYTLESPYRFKAGDAVRVACNWNNTTVAPLQFPGEMCVLAAWQIGAERDTMCFDGKWVVQ